jgi:hypothetical protein
MKRKTVSTIWEVWTYDVVGNKRDGYDVNDRSCSCRAYEIDCPVVENNPNTPQAFLSAYPTDSQVREALSIKPRVQIETDGDDCAIYVTHESTGYPLGELLLTSHTSLSPIKEGSPF